MAMALILLPEVADPVTAYTQTLHSAFQYLPKPPQTANPAPNSSTLLVDIALILKHSRSPQQATRSQLFSQSLLQVKRAYEAVLAAAKDIRLDLPGGVDARVFLLDLFLPETGGESIGGQTFSGPLIDCFTFINSGRSYNRVFVPDSEDGLTALQILQDISRSKYPSHSWHVQKLPSGPSMTSISSASPASASNNTSTHYWVAVGGTFDHLHIGHKLLLTGTIFVPEPTATPQDDQTTQQLGSPSSASTDRVIIVGITGDELLVNKKHSSHLESWSTRQEKTAEFIESILVFHPDIPSIKTVETTSEPGPNGHVVRVSYGKALTINYTRISDPYGPTITEESISAIVVSKETRAGGEAVNKKREEKGWKTLEIFEVDVLNPAEAGGGDEGSFASKISSTEIRRQLAEADGR